MQVPSDMTPDKLRQVAAAMDLFDVLFRTIYEQVEIKSDPTGVMDFVFEMTESSNMQDDLRRWAEEISIDPLTTAPTCD